MANLQCIARRMDRDPHRLRADFDRARDHTGRRQSGPPHSHAGFHRRRDARLPRAGAGRTVIGGAFVRGLPERPLRATGNPGSVAARNRHRVRHRDVLRAVDVVRNVGAERARWGSRSAADVERDGDGLSCAAADCARRRTLDRDGVLVCAGAGCVEWRGAVRGVAEELCRVLDELRAVSDLFHAHLEGSCARSHGTPVS